MQQQQQELDQLNPLHLIVWAGIEEVIKDARLAGLITLGRAIAAALPGDSMDEKLDQFEGGRRNREVFTVDDVAGKMVRLKRDVFATECCGLPWSRHTESLISRYNNEVPRGGAASHPLHIVLHEVHRGVGQIVEVATRHPITREVQFSRYGLQRLGINEERAAELLGDGAILYCILE